jgi:hypothetical protein
VGAAGAEDGENAAQFTMADERLASDERDVHGIVALDQLEDAADQIVAAEVGKIAELGCAGEVRITIGIASGTAQGAFASNFDREKRDFPTQDFPPGSQYVKWIHTRKTRLFWLKGCYLRDAGFGIYFCRTMNKDWPNGGFMKDSSREKMGTI